MLARDFARLSEAEETCRTGKSRFFGTWDWGTA